MFNYLLNYCFGIIVAMCSLAILFLRPRPSRLHRIALCGKMGSGKSTVARYLTEVYGFEELAFATPLEEMLMTATDGTISPYYLYHPDWKQEVIPELNVTGHQLLEAVGMMFREELPRRLPHLEIVGSWWVHVMWMKLRSRRNRVVISDLRLPDEEAMLRSLGFTIIHLDREVSTHITNQGLPRQPQDLVLSNTGSLKDLYKQIHALLK